MAHCSQMQIPPALDPKIQWQLPATLQLPPTLLLMNFIKYKSFGSFFRVFCFCFGVFARTIVQGVHIFLGMLFLDFNSSSPALWPAKELLALGCILKWKVDVFIRSSNCKPQSDYTVSQPTCSSKWGGEPFYKNKYLCFCWSDNIVVKLEPNWDKSAGNLRSKFCI